MGLPHVGGGGGAHAQAVALLELGAPAVAELGAQLEQEAPRRRLGAVQPGNQGEKGRVFFVSSALKGERICQM